MRLVLKATILYHFDEISQYARDGCSYEPFSTAVMSHMVDVLLDLNSAAGLYIYWLVQPDFRDAITITIEKLLMACSNPFKIKSWTNDYGVYTAGYLDGQHSIDLV